MHGVMELGGGVGIIGTIIIGGLAGWIAGMVTETRHGVIVNIIIGIIGSFIGSVLANALDIRLGEMFHGWFWGNLLVSIAGAVVLIVVLRAVRGRRA